MRKKLLIWSAVLTVVFGAALLQSCSADDDSYTTEEYGYYTAEEIDMIMTLAEMYEVDVKIDKNYYGLKKTMKEFEADFQSFSELTGEYRMTNGTVAYKNNTVIRTLSRQAESQEGSGSASYIAGDYTISVSLSWKTSVNEMPGTATGSFSVNKGETVCATGTLHCTMGSAGTITVTFSGSKTWTDDETTYTCTISQGSYDIAKNIGSFSASVVSKDNSDEPHLW